MQQDSCVTDVSDPKEIHKRSGFASGLDWVISRLLMVRENTMDPAYIYRARLLLFSLIGVLCVNMVLAFIELLWGNDDQWIVLTLMLIGPAFAIFDFPRSGRYPLYSQLFVGGMVMIVVVLTILSGGQFRGPLIATPTIAILAAMLLPARMVWIWSVLMLATIAVGHYLRVNEFGTLIHIDQEWVDSAHERIPATLLCLSALVGTWFFRMIENSHTNLKRTQEEKQWLSALAQKSNERLEQFAGIAAEWFWETNEKHQLVYLSPGFEEATGISRSSALGLTPAQVTSIRYPNALLAEAAMQPMYEKRTFKDQILTWHDSTTDELKQYVNSGEPYVDEQGGFLGFRGSVSDIRKSALSKHLTRDSSYDDGLSDSMTRRHMIEAVEHNLRLMRETHNTGWLVYIDIDDFHTINMKLNYKQGDQFLARFAGSLKVLIAANEGVARMNGDEFAILLLGRSFEQVTSIASQILAAARGLHLEILGSHGVEGSVSIGIAPLSASVPNATAALHAADAACKQAQAEGGSRICFSD